MGNKLVMKYSIGDVYRDYVCTLSTLNLFNPLKGFQYVNPFLTYSEVSKVLRVCDVMEVTFMFY